MRRHAFDMTAFVWGVVFLIASVVVALREYAGISPDVKWLLPAGLVVIGAGGIANALRGRRG